MVVDRTEQDVLGRYGPDSLSINQTNNQQCHHRWTEAAIGCCRTWSPPQNITIQTRVIEVTLWCAHRTWSVPLIAWKLLIIDFWNLPPPPGTAFAVKVSAVSLSFVWIRASTYTEKKSPHWCVQEVWSPSSHLSDVSMRVWPAALTHSRTARAIKNAGCFFLPRVSNTLTPELLSFYAVQITWYPSTSVGHTHLPVSWFSWPPWQRLCYKELCKSETTLTDRAGKTIEEKKKKAFIFQTVTLFLLSLPTRRPHKYAEESPSS